jgi:hypothetical protein
MDLMVILLQLSSPLDTLFSKYEELSPPHQNTMMSTGTTLKKIKKS